MTELIGKEINHYHIVEQLGQGGMAIVYKAYDIHLERNVAIKFIRRNAFSPDVLDRVLKRFDREAKSLAKLTHPNIVSIIDYGDFEGSPYLVMPYLPGGTLKQFLGTPMPLKQATNLLAPIADALAFAHIKSIVHRDIKPGNILITEGGQPMLTDFGIAYILNNEETTTLTGTGMGVGTPEYMSPEQAMGREVDGRTDIYSLGVVLYELVTGRKPYTADTPMAVILKQSTEPLPKPSQFVPAISEKVEQVLYKALAKDPANRYQSMGEFAAALKGLEREEPVSHEVVPARKLIPVTQEPDTLATRDELEVVETPKPIPPKPISPPSVETETTIPARKMQPWMIATVALVIVVALVLGIGVAAGWFSTPATTTPVPMTATQIAVAATQKITALPTATSQPSPTATNLPSPIATPALGIVSTKVSSVDGMILDYVPAGDFLMGSPDDVGDDDEHPQHTVYLDAYWIDQTEVTNAMYEKCVAAGACTAPSMNSSFTRDSYYGNTEYDNYPVIFVNWNQASAYCQWAGRELPTEAQWEKAARGTNGRTYPWGNQNPDSTLANYNGKDTTQVGSYPAGASPYGALDMAGNVWEWLADRYSSSYYSQSSTDNPQGPSGGNYHVVRGGSWGDDVVDGRSAFRSWGKPSDSSSGSGFRCSLSASVSP